MRTSRPVPRSARLANLAALLLFLAGAAFYARAWIGMRWLHDYVPAPDAGDFAAMAQFNRFWEMSRLGFGLMVAAVVVAILTAAVLAVVQRRRVDAPEQDRSPEPEGAPEPAERGVGGAD